MPDFGRARASSSPAHWIERMPGHLRHLSILLRPLLLWLALAAPGYAVDDAAASKPERLNYHRHIVPLLEKHCIDCHDSEQTDGEYRVDRFDLLIKGGKKASPAVLPGKADQSPLVHFITGERMPRMPHKPKVLTEEDIAVFREWIAQGAPEGQPAFGEEQLVFFETNIRPLLAANCFECHGPDKARGNLSFTSRASLLEGGNTGPALVPGDSVHSLRMKAVRHDGELRMPKGKAKLDDASIALLEKWIAMGAPWPATDESEAPKIRKRFVIYESDREHWAFGPVTRPSLPPVKN